MIVYKTTNLINGKIYIGRQLHDNPNYIGSGKIMHRAIEKYGRQNFKKETLETCSSIFELNEREKYWIFQLNSADKNIGYNIMLGGQGGNTFNYKCGPEHANYGKPVSQKVKNAVALANKLRPKFYGPSNKSYKTIDPKLKELIISLSQKMGRDKIYQTITTMGLKCPPPRTITRRLKEWSLS